MSRLEVELHPPLRDGSQQIIDLEPGTVGIITGPAPDGVKHIVMFEYGRHHSATVAIHPDHLVRA